MKLDPRNGINGLVLYFVQCITRGDWKAVEIAYSQWISTTNEWITFTKRNSQEKNDKKVQELKYNFINWINKLIRHNFTIPTCNPNLTLNVFYVYNFKKRHLSN